MASRLTTTVVYQEIAGSTPAVVIFFFIDSVHVCWSYEEELPSAIMFRSAATKIAHNSTIPALAGNQDLRSLQDLITAEKAVIIS